MLVFRRGIGGTASAQTIAPPKKCTASLLDSLPRSPNDGFSRDDLNLKQPPADESDEEKELIPCTESRETDKGVG